MLKSKIEDQSSFCKLLLHSHPCYHFLGLAIFDYFDLKELIVISRVSRVFYDFSGRREILNKFQLSAKLKKNPTSITIETIDNNKIELSDIKLQKKDDNGPPT